MGVASAGWSCGWRALIVATRFDGDSLATLLNERSGCIGIEVTSEVRSVRSKKDECMLWQVRARVCETQGMSRA